MTESKTSLRLKRLLHRSRYRGCLECDILLGRFAARYLPTFDARRLDQFEALLEEADADILAWVSGRRPVPARHDNEVMALLRRFRPAAR